MQCKCYRAGKRLFANERESVCVGEVQVVCRLNYKLKEWLSE
jgi:hypothetical protein